MSEEKKNLKMHSWSAFIALDDEPVNFRAEEVKTTTVSQDNTTFRLHAHIRDQLVLFIPNARMVIRDDAEDDPIEVLPMKAPNQVRHG